MNFMPYEVRAAVMILMARSHILALPGDADTVPPSKWKWTADQSAAFRAFADRHGYVFSSVPEYGRQSKSIQSTIDYVIINEVRKREGETASTSASDSTLALAAAEPAIAEGAATDGKQYDDDDILGAVADDDAEDGED